jgi:cell wall assembly regulator SMI1
MTDEAQQNIASVHMSWQRIESWLAAHAPSSLDCLNPPAADEAIEAAERALGTALPGDLAASLRCHDGVRKWATILPLQEPLSVERIVETRAMMMEIAADVDGFETKPWDDEPWWHPLWIPWATTADGVYHVIDLRPGPAYARVGWAGHSDGGSFSDGWPSLAAILHAVAQALHVGGRVDDFHPFLTSDGELWWDDADRRELNGKPLRPAPVGLD